MARFTIITDQSSHTIDYERPSAPGRPWPLEAITNLPTRRWENRTWLEFTDAESGEPTVVAVDSIAAVTGEVSP